MDRTGEINLDSPLMRVSTADMGLLSPLVGRVTTAELNLNSPIRKGGGGDRSSPISEHERMMMLGNSEARYIKKVKDQTESIAKGAMQIIRSTSPYSRAQNSSPLLVEDMSLKQPSLISIPSIRAQNPRAHSPPRSPPLNVSRVVAPGVMAGSEDELSWTSQAQSISIVDDDSLAAQSRRSEGNGNVGSRGSHGGDDDADDDYDADLDKKIMEKAKRRRGFARGGSKSILRSNEDEMARAAAEEAQKTVNIGGKGHKQKVAKMPVRANNMTLPSLPTSMSLPSLLREQQHLQQPSLTASSSFIIGADEGISNNNSSIAFAQSSYVPLIKPLPLKAKRGLVVSNALVGGKNTSIALLAASSAYASQSMIDLEASSSGDEHHHLPGAESIAGGGSGYSRGGLIWTSSDGGGSGSRVESKGGWRRRSKEALNSGGAGTVEMSVHLPAGLEEHSLSIALSHGLSDELDQEQDQQDQPQLFRANSSLSLNLGEGEIELERSIAAITSASIDVPNVPSSSSSSVNGDADAVSTTTQSTGGPKKLEKYAMHYLYGDQREFVDKPVLFQGPIEDPMPPVDELGFRIHNRMMGWKLTSPKRRKELVALLDIISKNNSGNNFNNDFVSQSKTSVAGGGGVMAGGARAAASWANNVSRLLRARARTPKGKFAAMVKEKESKQGKKVRGEGMGMIASSLLLEADKAGIHNTVSDWTRGASRGASRGNSRGTSRGTGSVTFEQLGGSGSDPFFDEIFLQKLAPGRASTPLATAFGDLPPPHMPAPQGSISVMEGVEPLDKAIAGGLLEEIGSIDELPQVE